MWLSVALYVFKNDNKDTRTTSWLTFPLMSLLLSLNTFCKRLIKRFYLQLWTIIFFIWKILTASRNSTQILVAITQNVVNIFFLTSRKYIQNSDILSFPCFLFWSFKIAFNFFNVCFDFSVSGHSPKSSCSNVFFNPFWMIGNNQVYKNIWTKPDVSNL